MKPRSYSDMKLPRGWQMPGPGAAQNLQIPCSSPGELGAAGIDWCIMQLFFPFADCVKMTREWKSENGLQRLSRTRALEGLFLSV